MDWWVAALLRRDPAQLVSWIVWVIGSIVLHELAHGWVAIAVGDRTPIETGHMTWNPLVHMGKLSLLAFALIGLAWGLMPVNPSRFRRPSDRALVAAAGPAMNLALAVVATILAAVWIRYGAGAGDNMYRNVQVFFITGAYLNLVLLALNLLPIPPLDGSVILATFSRSVRALYAHPRGQMVALGMLVLLLMYGFRYIDGPALRLVQAAVRAIGTALP